MADKPDKEIKSIVKYLLSNNQNIDEEIQKLDNLIFKSVTVTVERTLYKLIVTFLKSNNVDKQINALLLLCTCFTKGLFNETKYVDILQYILDIASNSTTNNTNNQDLWLKAFSSIELMGSVFYTEAFTNYIDKMITISEKVLSTETTAIQKINILKIVNKMISVIDLDANQNSLVPFCLKYICPLMFNLNNPNIQTSAIDLSYNLLPFLQKALQKNDTYYNIIYSDIKQSYLMTLKTLIEKENRIFANLWIFLMKLLGMKFLRDSPVVNMFLNIIEAAFKTYHHDVRMEAFHCWQALIESFGADTMEVLSQKHVKLLIIPLKTNNCKTEHLVTIKFWTWCKLMNMLQQKKYNFQLGVFDQFLYFCFGPLCEQPLISYTVHGCGLTTQGKRYPAIHLLCCKAFLQLMGHNKYIDEELSSKLVFFNFKGPLITPEIFKIYYKLIIDSVGEACVLLSQLEYSDRFECVAVNEALWKSLFHHVDTLDDENIKNTSTENIAGIILALARVSRKKQYLISFGLITLLNIITSGEFQIFKKEETTESLFIPMIYAIIKKDKTLLQFEIVSIFKKIFDYKRDESNYLKFLQKILERFSVTLQDNNATKKVPLYSIWFLLEEELRIVLQNTSFDNVDQDLFITVFSQFLGWPISSVNKNFEDEKLIVKWKELYDLIAKSSTNSIYSKLNNTLISDLYIVMVNNQQISILEIIYHIISKLNYDCSEDCNDIIFVYSKLKELISLQITIEGFREQFEKIFNKIFADVVKLEHLHNIFESILDCLETFLNVYNDSNIFDDLLKFVTALDYNEKLKNSLQRLNEILKTCNISSDLLNLITSKVDEKLNNFEHIKIKFRLESNGVPKLIPCNSLNTSKSAEETEPLTLLGHDVNTMEPAESKNDSVNKEEIFVNEKPYKLSVKKLTKHQKEKLSKRSENIPALYEDLSRSQTLDLSSNSDSKTEDENKTKDNSALETNETNVEISFSILDPKNKTEISSVTKAKNTNIPENVEQTTNLKNISDDKITEGPSNKRKRQSNQKSDFWSYLKDNPSKRNSRKVKMRMSETDKNLESSSRNNNMTDQVNYSDVEVKRSTRRKISKGRRRQSTGSVNASDDKIQQRVIRELRKIQMDIKNSEEYVKSDRRKLRTCKNSDSNSGEITVPDKKPNKKSSNVEKSEKVVEESPKNDKKKSSTEKSPSETNKKPNKKSPNNVEKEAIEESQEIIESSQEPEVELNIKPCLIPLCRLVEVKPGVIESGDLQTDVIKEPEPSTPLTVLDNSSVSTSPSCNARKKIIFSAESKEELKNSETESISSEVIAELNVTENENSEKSQTDLDKSVRKVLFDTSDAELEKLSEESLENSNIVTSPVSNDTPTRNKEFLKDTSEISPIKNLSRLDDNDLKTSSEIITPGNQVNSDQEKVGIDLSHSNKIGSKKSQKVHGGRINYMMDLIKAKSLPENSSTKKKNVNVKSDFLISPAQKRISKMMEYLEKPEVSEPEVAESKGDKIKNEDIFTFSKELPSPFASPSCSILKKRAHSDDSEENALRACKRRRVNFSDPPVSCRKYIEKNARFKFNPDMNHDYIPPEPRDTRLSKSLSLVADNLEELEESCETESPNIFIDCSPISETLSSSTDLISVLKLPEEVSSKFDDKNIKTVGDLAKLTKQEIYDIHPDVNFIEEALISILNNPIVTNEPITLDSFKIDIPGNETESEFVENNSNLKTNSETVLPHLCVVLERITSKQTLSLKNQTDSILNEEIVGGTVEETILSIIEKLNDKEYDLQPLLKLILEKIPHFIKTVMSLDEFKNYYKENENWQNFLKDLVKNNNIKEMINYLGSMEEIDKKSIVESLLKDNFDAICEQLNVDDMINYLAKTKRNNFTDIVKYFDTETVCNSLVESKEHREQLFKIFPKLMKTPKDLILPDLKIVEIGNEIVERMDSTDLDEFLEEIFKIVPSKQYLTPVPVEILIKNIPTPTLSIPENVQLEFGKNIYSFIEKLQRGQLSDNLQTFILKCIFQNMNVKDLTEIAFSEIQKKL